MSEPEDPNGIWREIVKIVIIAALTSAATTYATVQSLTKDVARLEVRMERLIGVMESFSARISTIEGLAAERGPRMADIETRLRALEHRR